MRQFKTLALRSSATFALLSVLSLSAQAQVSVSEDTSDQILTSTAADDGTASDVTIESGTTVTVDAERSGVILDSDNALVLDGVVSAEDIDNVTGVELQGGADRSYSQTGTISLLEDFTAEDTDDDPFADGPFAEGTGRTGILISGASPFQGNVELTATSSIGIEGNDSYGINLANTPMMTEGLTGNLLTSGQISVAGDRSVGINLASNITGDVTNEGNITARGEDSQAYVVSGDIAGAFDSSGTISNSGYRFTSRPSFGGEDSETGREDLGAEDLLQAGSAVEISGNVTDGIHFSQVITQAFDDEGNPSLDDAGEEIFILTASSSVSQFGSAPAVLIDGNGTPLSVGLVAEITDVNDEDFDEDLQFGFINDGTISASGVYDDVDATALSLADVTIENGISNTGSLTALSFRAPTSTDLADGDGIARVLVLGNQAIADQINNSGVILASASEATDEIYFDRDNIIAPRALLAVGIDIGSNASVEEIVNTGSITTFITGREGSSIALRDLSGTVQSLENTGTIAALATSSDSLGEEDTDFVLTAIDLSAATQGVEITQNQNEDSTNTPLVRGDVLLGSGDDIITSNAGAILGNIDFGGGSDSLTLTGESAFAGSLLNADGLALSVTDGSTLALASNNDITVSEALFDGTSSYRPVIDGETGIASTFTSAGSITFEDGATINPILNSIVGTDTLSYTLATAADLTIENLEALSTGESPFLYATSLGLADPNTLVVTLDLRNPTASVADGGLGLDSVQAAAFGSVVDGVFQEGPVLQALSSATDLGNAFANIIGADDFYAAYNQVLPEFSGAAKQFILANVDGAVGAVGSHLDTARRSPDKTGGAWLEEFFYFADRSLAGQSEQYRGDGFGFAGGLDTAFGPFHAIGVSAGFASTEIEDVIGSDDPMHVRTYQLGAYAGYQTGGFNLDIYGGGGISDFEQSRNVLIDDYSGSADGEWEGTHANASLRAGYEVALSEKFWARPSLSLDYLYLNETGHTDTGDSGIRLRVDGRQTESASFSAMLDLGASFQGKRTWIRPSIRAGYRNEFMSDPTLTSFRFQGLTDSSGNLFDSEIATLRSFAFPDESLLLGFTVAAGSQYSSIGFDFDSDIRDGFIRHTGRIVIRLLF